MKPYLVGVTGGIGSGKSVVSHLLRIMQIPVYDCDSEAKRLMTSSAVIRRELIGRIGDAVYLPDGMLNRPLLSSWLFSDESHRSIINGIVHPCVKQDLLQWAERQGMKHSIVAFESAILFESGFQSLADEVLMVYAPLETRLQRVIKRDEADCEAVRRRMAAQMDDETKRKQASHVIVNDGKEPVLPQLISWLEHIRSL